MRLRYHCPGRSLSETEKLPRSAHLYDSVCSTGRQRGKSVSFLTESEKKGGNALVFFTDCDGNIVHLLQREKPLPWGLAVPLRIPGGGRPAQNAPWTVPQGRLAGHFPVGPFFDRN